LLVVNKRPLNPKWPEVIIEEYEKAKAAWRSKNKIPAGSTYRKAVGLPSWPVSYRKEEFERMGWRRNLTTGQLGLRDWTIEEVEAYCDYLKAAEDTVNRAVALEYSENSSRALDCMERGTAWERFNKQEDKSTTFGKYRFEGPYIPAD